MAKRVFVVGGTGFLGYHAVMEFVAHGWAVTAFGLPPAPPDALFPPDVRVVLQNLYTIPDQDLLELLEGHIALVFAAGLDDRYTPTRPAYPKFYQANVASLERLMRLAQQAGVKRVVVLGSYFAHFDRQRPAMKLAEWHPYIRSRVEQERLALQFPGVEGMVLELPYIFGAMPLPSWRPLWAPLVRYIRSSPVILYMKGGTACVSVQTVARAIVAAVENGRGGECYPIGQENLTWTEMLTRLARADGREVRVVKLPTWMIWLGMLGVTFLHWLQGRESGLNLGRFIRLQTAETFLDPHLSQQALGYAPADMEAAFLATVKACP